MFYRVGLLAVRWRYWIIALWALVALASLPFAPRVAQVLAPGGFSSPDMESQRAVDALQQGLHTSFTTVDVIFTSETLTADDPRFVTQANAAVAGLQGWPEVTRVVPFTLSPEQVSRDHKAAYTAVFLKADADNAPKVLPELRSRLQQPADLQMIVGGAPVFYADVQAVTESDLRRAELLAFPFALLALLLVFRSVVGATLPATVGGASVVVSLALLYAFASVSRVSIFALNITTLFGLGLGVDYSLFMLSRFREELARGRAVPDAVAVTMSTAGRAVFFSGLAVSVGLLGLVIFPLNMLRSVGLGGMMTVLLAALAAATLLPALFGVLGHRVNALPVRLPRFGRARRATVATRDDPSGAEHGFWHGLALWVMRRPVATLVPVLAILLLLGAPYLSVRLAAPDASILPDYVKSREAYNVLTTRFDGPAQTPIVIAVQTQSGGPLAKVNLIALDRYVRTLASDSRVQRVDSLVSLDPRLTLDQYLLLYSDPQSISDPYIAQSLGALAGDHISLVRVISRYPMLDERTESLVTAIRGTPPPSGLTTLVDGGTAGIIDYVNTLYGALPIAALLIFAITFVMLTLLFRSLVLPLKAILMNILSILASYGALVFIFQQGHLSGLLNFTPLGFVEASGPILMFCALFGLSMDYEVFLLSRIRESWEQTHDNTHSVAVGLERSGRIITSAAAIVILVSLSFAAADLVIVKALGVGMALAVLLDATLVRGLLVPATMRLLGNINWYWPRWLERLVPHQLFAEAHEPPPVSIAAESAAGQTERDALPIGGEG
jgi:RND superfamily putative drug exporter